jgi:hypothetical protein
VAKRKWTEDRMATKPGGESVGDLVAVAGAKRDIAQLRARVAAAAGDDGPLPDGSEGGDIARLCAELTSCSWNDSDCPKLTACGWN